MRSFGEDGVGGDDDRRDDETAAFPFASSLPYDVQLSVLTYLRASELAAVQESCRYFASPSLVSDVIAVAATRVYPPDLTEGFDDHRVVGGRPASRVAATDEDETRSSWWFTNYEPMRNMETLVVARVLSRPEPRDARDGFYVSKAWCRTALRWLEYSTERRRRRAENDDDDDATTGTTTTTTTSPRKGKKARRRARAQSRRSGRDGGRSLRGDGDTAVVVPPPNPNANHDLTCPHGDGLPCGSSGRAARARRRVMDKQAWRVLRRLWPDSAQLPARAGVCPRCALEEETARRAEEARRERERADRRRPLVDPTLRRLYARGNAKGVDARLLRDDAAPGRCPLVPGVYHALPRSWCRDWRRHLRSGGDRPDPPDCGALLCDAHKLPLVPPHLEAFLSGESPHLLAAAAAATAEDSSGNVASYPARAVGDSSSSSSSDAVVRDSLVAAGLSGADLESELRSQRLALADFERNQQRRVATRIATDHPRDARRNNDRLDRENDVVVEILSEDELVALAEWWPEIRSSFVARFAVLDDGEVAWSTNPCRECDARHNAVANVVVRNRNRKWAAAV